MWGFWYNFLSSSGISESTFLLKSIISHPAAVAAAGLMTFDFPFVSDIVRSRILSTLIVGAEKCFTCWFFGGFIRDVSSGTTPTTDG